jgi:hypothetical protein
MAGHFFGAINSAILALTIPFDQKGAAHWDMVKTRNRSAASKTYQRDERSSGNARSHRGTELTGH